MANYLIVGSEEHLRTALSRKPCLWGVKEGSIVPVWNRLKEGDVVALYAKAPTSGIVGFGRITGKDKNSELVWSDEIRDGICIYPYKIMFEPLPRSLPESLLKSEKWGESSIDASGLKILASVNDVANLTAWNRVTSEAGSKWPELAGILKEGSVEAHAVKTTAAPETQEVTYFILITGSKEYEDSKERYHFRKGIPGCNQLLEAEHKGKFVYYQDGKFYAKGEIGDISSEEKEGTTFYYAKIENYEEIGPVKFWDMRADISFGSVGAAGIRKIDKEDYDTIVGKASPQSIDFIKKDLELPGDFTLDPLLFEDKENLETQTAAALKAGNNIMLVGPPGTGKTEVALSLGTQFSEKGAVNKYVMTTATSDWTTFDTIGGYVPRSDGKGLDFQPGLFLRCFKNADKPINRWLIIDEINRADIDKAFGQLFTLLSGQSIELPFQKESKNIEILSHKGSNGRDIALNQYVVPKSWRLIATLNTYDKASLYQMSYAFMRRFAFIHVAAPSRDFIEEKWGEYLACWKLRVPAELTSCADSVKELWKNMNEDSKRPLGPAIIKDMLHYILNQAEKYGHLDDGIRKKIVTNAVISFILPQFEGLEKSDLDNLKKRISQHCLSDKIDSLCHEMFEG